MGVLDKEWLDAPRLLRWLAEEEGVGPGDLEAKGFASQARRMRGWERQEAVSVYTADDYLTKLGIPLAWVPEELYRERGPSRARRVRNPEERRRAVELFRQGYTPSQIGHRLGRSRRTIADWLDKAGVPRPRRGDAAIRARAVELHRNGMSGRQIARELGVHDSTVSRWLRDARQEALL